MQILIVEDNAFSAFCLTRLLTAICPEAHVVAVSDSHAAMKHLENQAMDLVILDGDLGAGDGRYCNGPVLADLIWRKFPNTIIAAWTDNTLMREAFAEVFANHQKQFNQKNAWNKTINQTQLLEALAHLGLIKEGDECSMSFIPVLTNSNGHFERYR